MKKLAAKFKQNSIFIVPMKGTGLPYLYYLKDGSIEKADSDTPEVFDNMAEKYFSQLNGQKKVREIIGTAIDRRSGYFDFSMEPLTITSFRQATIADAPAYWICPFGKILPVRTTHIAEVCKNPKSFGLDKKYVKSIYFKFREHWGLEGKARDELMREIIGNGWIRCRYVSYDDFFTIEAVELSDTNKGYLWAWAVGLMESSGDKYKTTEVKICEHRLENRTTSGSMEDLAAGRMFSRIFVKDNILVPIKSVFQFMI